MFLIATKLTMVFMVTAPFEIGLPRVRHIMYSTDGKILVEGLTVGVPGVIRMKMMT